MNPTHTTGPGLSRDEYSDLAFNLMVNRRNKKGVVVRRDASFGMKPVVFKFRPTIDIPVTSRGTALAVNSDDVNNPNVALKQWKRVLAPWIPFTSFDSASGLQTNVNVRHNGLCIALRPESLTEHNFPVLQTKTYIDVEYRGSRVYLTNQNGSYGMFPWSTRGDGM